MLETESSASAAFNISSNSYLCLTSQVQTVHQLHYSYYLDAEAKVQVTGLMTSLALFPLLHFPSGSLLFLHFPFPSFSKVQLRGLEKRSNLPRGALAKINSVHNLPSCGSNACIVTKLNDAQ